MQTFMPYASFSMSAECLDSRRLNKQIIEVSQIYDTIVSGKKAWSNHPAVNMWRGYEKALLWYGLACYEGWIERYEFMTRGGKKGHKSGEKIVCEFQKIEENILDYMCEYPPWIGCEYLHYTHRANLIRKNSEYYSKFWPNVEPMNFYFWPV